MSTLPVSGKSGGRTPESDSATLPCVCLVPLYFGGEGLVPLPIPLAGKGWTLPGSLCGEGLDPSRVCPCMDVCTDHMHAFPCEGLLSTPCLLLWWLKRPLITLVTRTLMVCPPFALQKSFILVSRLNASSYYCAY